MEMFYFTYVVSVRNGYLKTEQGRGYYQIDECALPWIGVTWSTQEALKESRLTAWHW